MSYTAPTITASGKTFAQLQGMGLDGLLDAVSAANSLTAFQAAEVRRLAGTLDGPKTLVRSYLAGDPVTTAETNARALDHATAYAVVLQALNEAGTLLAANAGTLAVKTSPFSGVSSVRTFP